jgi:hypothetical protein
MSGGSLSEDSEGEQTFTKFNINTYILCEQGTTKIAHSPWVRKMYVFMYGAAGSLHTVPVQVRTGSWNCVDYVS